MYPYLMEAIDMDIKDVKKILESDKLKNRIKEQMQACPFVCSFLFKTRKSTARLYGIDT